MLGLYLINDLKLPAALARVRGAFSILNSKLVLLENAKLCQTNCVQAIISYYWAVFVSILSFLIFFCGDCEEICCPLVELTKWICTKASFAMSSHPIMYLNKMFKGVCYQAAGDNNKFSLAKYQSCLISVG